MVKITKYSYFSHFSYTAKDVLMYMLFSYFQSDKW
jgi:hypothetical protein